MKIWKHIAQCYVSAHNLVFFRCVNTFNNCYTGKAALTWQGIDQSILELVGFTIGNRELIDTATKLMQLL